jgi:trimeric autotransporter adhesin
MIMRSRYFIASMSIVLLAAVFAPQFSYGQFSITTVAGGGPNNLPATHASLGYTGGVALDGAGNTYIADSYSSQIFKIDSSGNVTVLAGNGFMGYSGDGGPATSASLNRPEAVAVDASGNVFIADTDNFVIREVVASSGKIQTVAGNGKEGYSGDGGPATSAQLDDPFGVFVDGSGNIFIADTDNSIIREVSNGTINTVAGTPGVAGYAGDSGLATAAQLDEPEGVYVDGSGDIFIADTFNSVIREVTAGTISTIAGSYYAWNDSCNYSGDGSPATSAQLCLPSGVFVDGSGDIFIADTENFIIREVTSGIINTVAGTPGMEGYSGDGGSATSADLNYPSTMVVDGSGDIFIADTENYVIREVSGGNIATFAGNNTLAYSGDGGLATSAALNFPGETFVDSQGDVFIADSDSSVIREVVAATGNIETVAGNGISGYSGDSGLATAAELNFPSGVFVDGSGDIVIADTENSVIREVAAATGDIATVAGDGTPGYMGDGSAATLAELNNPAAVVIDSSGNIYIADTGNSAVRVVNTGSQAITIAAVTIQPGTIQTVAGNGTACSDPSSGCGDNGPATSAELNFPSGVSLDASGDIFVADTFNDAVREINSAGLIQTVVGMMGQRGYTGDNGPPTSASLDTPYGLFVDSYGNIFIADTDNAVIREVVAVTSTIQTVAGNGTEGFFGDGGTATTAQLADPLGLSGSASGTMYIADTQNSRIRRLSSTVNVAIEPSSASVIVTAPQPFGSIVTGARNSDVTWQVNGVTGGNSRIGTISSSGVYQAPANIPSQPAVTVNAVSNANGFTKGSATVTIVGGNAPNVSVTTTPAGVSEVYTAMTQTFNAKVNGESNTAVTWQVNGIAGGNASTGTISSSGLYSAPNTVPLQPLVLITAVSQANSALSGSYPITVVTVPSASQPAPQTISPGSSATYSISLNANTGSPKQPITLSCVQSSLPPGATCSFSPKTITPSNKAVPFTLTVNVPSGTTAAAKPANLWLAPQICFGFMPIAGILVIGGKRNRKWLCLAMLCILLLATIGCGGGSSNSSSSGPNPEAGSYTIQIQGTTAAQPTAVTITTAGLTVN